MKLRTPYITGFATFVIFLSGNTVPQNHPLLSLQQFTAEDHTNEVVPITLFFNIQSAFKGNPENEVRSIEELAPDATRYFVPLYRINDEQGEYKSTWYEASEQKWQTETIKQTDIQSHPDYLAYAFVMRLFDPQYDLMFLRDWTSGDAQLLVDFEINQERVEGAQTFRLQDHDAIHHIASVTPSQADPNEYLVRVFRMNRPSEGLDQLTLSGDEYFYIQEWRVTIAERNGKYYVDNLLVFPFQLK